MTDLEIRRATADDLPALAELAGRLARMHHEADPARFFLPERVEEGYVWWLGRELARNGAVVLCAARGREVLGYAYGTLEARDFNLLLDEHGAIHDLYVDESVRRSRVGRRLVDAMIAELEALGAPQVLLGTMVANHSAQALFRAAGFRPTLLEMTRNRTSG